MRIWASVIAGQLVSEFWTLASIMLAAYFVAVFWLALRK